VGLGRAYLGRHEVESLDGAETRGSVNSHFLASLFLAMLRDRLHTPGLLVQHPPGMSMVPFQQQNLHGDVSVDPRVTLNTHSYLIISLLFHEN
jgi:hypothetical protein